MPKQLTPKQILSAWAERNDKNAADFGRDTSYSYNHAYQLLHGEAEITESTLGRLLLVYGPDMAEPIAAVMRKDGMWGDHAMKKMNGGE